MYAILDSGNTTSGKVKDLVSIPSGGTLADAKGITAAQQALCIAIPSGVPVGVGWSYSNGTFAPPAPTNTTPPTIPQQAQAALAAGLPCTSSTTPALNATYPLTDAMQNNLIALDHYYGKFGTFPNKATTIQLQDITGAAHTFSYAQFEALLQTLGDYRAALLDCIANGTTPPDPSNFGTLP